MNTTFTIQKAVKKKAKLRLGIGGVSGSGKTYSALLLANGLAKWNKIVVIDTENESANLYSDLGKYSVLPLSEPYTPERYIETITACEQAGFDVIIIDSISHEWEGSGGILEIHGNMQGNSFTNWAKITPRHRALIDKILHCSTHIIVTFRKKQEYALNQEAGKLKVEKMGLKNIQREGMDYEMTVHLDLNLKHYVTASKDRSRLFMDKPEFIITSETGKLLKNWLESEDQPICTRCDAKFNKKTEITKAQAEKTEKIYKWALCKKCELLAKKHKAKQGKELADIEKEIDIENIKQSMAQEKKHKAKIKGALAMIGKKKKRNKSK